MLGYQGNTYHALTFFEITVHIILKMSSMHFFRLILYSKSLFDLYNILGQGDCNIIRKISNYIFYMLKKRNSITICEIR